MSSPKRVRKRAVFIALLVGTQLVCLLAGLFLFSTLFNKRIRTTLREAVQANNQQIAEQVCHYIEELHPTDIRRGTQDWLAIQKIIEQFRLPNQGFVSVIESQTGELLCHPDLATLRSIPSPANAILYTTAGPQVVREAAGVGIAKLSDGNHLMAVRNLPELSIRVLAHQKEQSLLSTIHHITKPLLPIGLTILLLVVCLTLATTFVVIKRYENRLADVNENLEREVDMRTKALKKTRNATIFGLAKLAESRDTDTGDHLDRIRSFVTILARRLQAVTPELTNEYIETLGIASSLHDIGKVGIPDRVLLKPGRLDADQREVMETHTTIGADCIAAIIERLGEDDFLMVAHEIALWHHEKFDGTGYPTRLAGTEIPISARITALADVYDALISPRVYKRPMTHEQAREIILEGAGQHFDPAIVAAFLACEDKFEVITDALHARIDQALTSNNTSMSNSQAQENVQTQTVALKEEECDEVGSSDASEPNSTVDHGELEFTNENAPDTQNVAPDKEELVAAEELVEERSEWCEPGEPCAKHEDDKTSEAMLESAEYTMTTPEDLPASESLQSPDLLDTTMVSDHLQQQYPDRRLHT